MSPILAAILHKLETGIPVREAPNTSSGKLGAAVRIPILLAKSCCVLTLGPVKLPPAAIWVVSPADVLRSVAVLRYPAVPKPITVDVKLLVVIPPPPPAAIWLPSPADVLRSVAVLIYPAVPKPITVDTIGPPKVCPLIEEILIDYS